MVMNVTVQVVEDNLMVPMVLMMQGLHKPDPSGNLQLRNLRAAIIIHVIHDTFMC